LSDNKFSCLVLSNIIPTDFAKTKHVPLGHPGPHVCECRNPRRSANLTPRYAFACNPAPDRTPLRNSAVNRFTWTSSWSQVSHARLNVNRLCWVKMSTPASEGTKEGVPSCETRPYSYKTRLLPFLSVESRHELRNRRKSENN
jgi:hypothetical protein